MNSGATTYTYDAAGNRARKDSGGSWMEYVRFGGSILAENHANSGNGQWTDYIFAGGTRLAEATTGNPTSPSTTTTYYGGDQIGSARILTNGSGGTVESYEYYPFGQGPAPDSTNHYLFSGKERDSESGNDYFGARYYAATSGRFLSPDWSAKAEPVPYSKLDDPQSLNLYAYVRNNPVGSIDADGHNCQGSNASTIACKLDNGPHNVYHGEGQLQPKDSAQQQNTGNVVYNETGGLRPKAKDGSGSSQNLHDSRVAVADVIDNRNKAGAKGGVASDAVSAKERNNPQYKDSQAAASEAANSPDRTGGSTHFYLDYGQPKPSWANGKATTSYGPFVNAAGGGDVPKGADVRIIIVHPEDQQ